MGLVYPEGYNFDCNGCGKCCRFPWMVGVNPHVYQKLKDTPWLEAREAAHGAPILTPLGEGAHELVHKEDGSCLLLTPANRCEIHAELGFDSKPTMCQQFPFLIVHTPVGTQVGLSFFCDAVQNNEGGPLERYTDQVEGWVKVARYPTISSESLYLDEGIGMDWDAYTLFQNWLQEQLAATAVPTAALWGGVLGVCRLATYFKTAGVSRVTSANLQSALGSLSTRFLWNDDFRQYTYFSMSVLAAAWETRQPDEIKVVRKAILEGTDYFSTLLGVRVSTSAAQRYAPSVEQLDWKASLLRRYLSHVVFRHFLAQHPLLVTMSTLYLGAALVDQYFLLSTLAAKRDVPTSTDFWKAVDIVETRLLGHGTLDVELRAVCAKGYTDQIQTIDSAEMQAPL